MCPLAPKAAGTESHFRVARPSLWDVSGVPPLGGSGVSGRQSSGAGVLKGRRAGRGGGGMGGRAGGGGEEGGDGDSAI